MVDGPASPGDGAAREPGSDTTRDDEAARADRVEDCDDAHDDEIARKLAALAARSDPVPQRVVDAARAALRARAGDDKDGSEPDDR